MQDAFCAFIVWAFPTLVLAHSYKNVVTVCLGRCQCKCEENGHQTRLWFATSGSCLYWFQLHLLICFSFSHLPSVEMLNIGCQRLLQHCLRDLRRKGGELLSVEFSLLEPSNLVTLSIKKCVSPTLRKIQIPSVLLASWFWKQFNL